MKLSSGYIIVGAYADKIRRTLFAQLRDKIKAKEMDSKTVAKAAADLNKLLYEILVNKLKLDKGDVVRIRVEYEVLDGEIRWILESLKIEAFRRIPDDEIEPILREAIHRIEELEEIEEVRFEVERVGETDLGDDVYFVKLGEEKVGALVVTPLDGEAIVRGAIVKPNPIVIEKTKVEIEESLNETLVRLLEQRGREVEEEIAERIMKEIEDLVQMGK